MDIERLKYWKGNAQYMYGYEAGMRPLNTYLVNNIIYVMTHTNVKKKSSDYITGFEAGIKEAKMLQLLEGN